MQKAETKFLFERNGTFYVRMVVPKDRRSAVGRAEIQKSLRTKIIEDALILLGDGIEHCKRIINSATEQLATAATVNDRCKTLGLERLHDSEIVSLPVAASVDVLAYGLEMLAQIKTPAKIDFAAIGGVFEAPALTMRQALQQFETDSSDLWMNLSHRERQKKWNKYKEAVTDFENEMGADTDVLKLTKKDVYEYRSRLIERVKAGTVKVDTIRKKLMWLRVIVRHNYEMEGIKDSPFENLRPIKGIGDEQKRRVITEPEAVAIRKHYDDVGANDELVAIMAVIENTGAHAKEIVMLCADDIRLDDPIPNIRLQPNEHRSLLKTDSRIRTIPIVGIALDALKRFPDGFPRYRRDNGSEALSAAANKLIQTVADGASTYGYRHRIANLMKAGYVENGELKHISDSVKDSILGHSSDGKMTDYYGDETPLPVKLDVLKKILPDHAY